MDFYVHKEENEFHLSWTKKGEENRYLIGMDGGFLVAPFQCDLCWFRNLERRSPVLTSYSDLRLLGFIRRVNLDILWSRAPGTISSIKNGIMNLMRSWKELHMRIDLPPVGPWKVEDAVGFRVAIGQLRYSQGKGHNRSTHLQFDSVRKLRTSFAHLHANSRLAQGTDSTSFKAMKGQVFTVTDSPTDSRLYQLFMRGLLLRMGRQVESNWGLDYRVLGLILDSLEVKVDRDNITEEKSREAIILGAFLVVSFVCALRGNEGFMLEADGLQQMIEFGKNEEKEKLAHVVMPLLGRFKNEDGEKWHVMVAVSTTGSGLRIRFWLEMLVQVLVAEKKDTLGPAFCTKEGEMIDYWEMNNKFITEVEAVQEDYPDLLDQTIEIGDHFSIFRSLRKGSTARATDMEVDETAIDLHNRWRTMERTGGQRSTRSMRTYYNDLRLTLNTRLTYSRAL